MKTIKAVNLNELPTLADIDFEKVLIHSDFYIFEEIDGKLVSYFCTEPDGAFIVGEIESLGENKVVRHEGKFVARKTKKDDWMFIPQHQDLKFMTPIKHLDLRFLFSHSSKYTPECFQEVDGHLVAMCPFNIKDDFNVGPIERCEQEEVVRYDGRIIARKDRNTGWRFVSQEEEEA